MQNFDTMVNGLNGQLDDVNRMDRAQIGRDQKIRFSINGTTWCEWIDGGLHRLYALDDDHLPLAKWASQQLPKHILILAYRPLRRIVIKDLSRNLILKGYAAGKSQKPCLRHQIAERAGEDVSGLRIPSLLRHNKMLSALELEHIDFEPVRITSATCHTLNTTGRLLAQWQKNEGTAAHQLNRFTWEDELHVLNEWRTKIEALGITIPQCWHQALEFLQSKPPTDNNLLLTHRDIHDGQWLYSTSALCLLDFDSLCTAHPMLDLANFLAHIDLRYLQRGAIGAQSHLARARSLLEGYSSFGAVNAKDLRWFRISTLLRLALVYSIRPRWRSLTKPLSQQANAQIQNKRLSAEY